MPRTKLPKSVKEIVEIPIENAEEQIENVEQPVVEQDVEDPIINRVINKLEKVITIKRVLSDKQKQHLDKLAKIRDGKKYTQKLPEPIIEQVEPMVEPVKKVKKQPVKKVIKKEPDIIEQPITKIFSRKLF